MPVKKLKNPCAICGGALKRGATRFCSSVCLGKHQSGGKKAHSRAWNTWSAMKSRCTNPNNPAYKNYGGRGISFDPKWESFDGFWEDMENGYADNLSLERTNNNGNYCKENCTWIELAMQRRNTRRTVWLEVGGERRKLIDLAEESGINYHTLYNRLYGHGWSIERALNITS